MRWNASARARLGFLVMPSWMIYGTGGLAWQNFRFGASCSVAGGFCTADRNETASTTRLGWTIGGGIEALLPGSWLARAEYRYADFGGAGNTFFAGSGDDVFVDVNVRTHTLLLGVAIDVSQCAD
jgi:outer membrane immunogenic protein